MSLLGSIIPEPYGLLARIAAIAIIFVGAFATGWIKRGEADQDKIDQAIIKDQTKIIKIDHSQTIINNDLVNQLQKQVDALRIQNGYLQKKIVVIPDTCVLSKSWTDIYNESIVTPQVTP